MVVAEDLTAKRQRAWFKMIAINRKLSYVSRAAALSAALIFCSVGCSSGPQELRYSRPHLGMTKDEVVHKTWWSLPDDKHSSQMNGHIYEYWSWGSTGKRSVMFDNGRVVVVNE